jgi:hypothetical protein
VAISVYDVEKTDNVWVVHLFQERDFANCGTGNTFIFAFKTNLLESNDPSRVKEIAGFVDYAVCAFMEESAVVI